jgi:hypothetical protein
MTGARDPESGRLDSEERDPESGRLIRDEELDWAADHLDELRRSVSEHCIRNQLLWSGLAIGLAAHVVGYLLKSSATGEPIAVLADVLYTLGYALWTGVVVVALVEIIPAIKERQISTALDAYEAALQSRARAKNNVRPTEDTPKQR